MSRVTRFHEGLHVLLACAMDVDGILHKMERLNRRIPPEAVTDIDVLATALAVALLRQCRDRLAEIEKGGAK